METTDQTIEPKSLVNCAASSVYNLSQHRWGLEIIFNSGGIPILLDLLSSSCESTLVYAMTTVYNLLMGHEGYRITVCMAGSPKKMVHLLRGNNVELLAVTTKCLQLLLASELQEMRFSTLAKEVPMELVRIMLTYEHEELLDTTSRLLFTFSRIPKYKSPIVTAGGMQGLGMHLGHQNQQFVRVCLNTLRNLSAYAAQMDSLGNVLEKLVLLLESDDMDIADTICNILIKLTSLNRLNRAIICQVGGIQALISTISRAGDREFTVTSALPVLRNLTVGHVDEANALHAVRLHQGLPLIAQLLHPASSWLLVLHVVDLLVNLIRCPDNHNPLRQSGIIPRLVHLRGRILQAVNRRPPPHPGDRMSVDGVWLEPLERYALDILTHLQDKPHNRELVRCSYLFKIYSHKVCSL